VIRSRTRSDETKKKQSTGIKINAAVVDLGILLPLSFALDEGGIIIIIN